MQVYTVSQWLADGVGEAISAFDLDEGGSNAHRSCELHVFFMQGFDVFVVLKHKGWFNRGEQGCETIWYHQISSESPASQCRISTPKKV